MSTPRFRLANISPRGGQFEVAVLTRYRPPDKARRRLARNLAQSPATIIASRCGGNFVRQIPLGRVAFHASARDCAAFGASCAPRAAAEVPFGAAHVLG